MKRHTIFNRLGASLLALMGLVSMPDSAQAIGEVKLVSGEKQGNCFNPTISPDGTKIAYEVNKYEERVIDLFVKGIPVDASREKLIEPNMLDALDDPALAGFDEGGGQVSYELSWFQGHKFVYSSSGLDKNFQIYSQKGRALAKSEAADGQPAVSTDGSHLVFTSARTGEGDLYLMDSATKQVKQLTNYAAGPEWYPRWSPTAKSLVYVQHTPESGDNLYLMADPLGAAKGVKLTNWTSIQTKPSWSPDGTKIAFYSNHEAKERYDLYVMDAKAGATPKLLLKNVIPNERRGPTWSPDSQSLVQAINNAQQYQPLMVVSATTPGQTRKLKTQTQNNSDAFVVKGADGQIYLTFVAQGRTQGGAAGDNSRTHKDFMRVYLTTLSDSDLKTGS